MRVSVRVMITPPQRVVGSHFVVYIFFISLSLFISFGQVAAYELKPEIKITYQLKLSKNKLL